MIYSIYQPEFYLANDTVIELFPAMLLMIGQIVTIFVKQIHDDVGNQTGLQVSIGPLYECNWFVWAVDAIEKGES